MGMFKNTLLLAQQGNEKAMEKLLNRYDPLLKKCSIIQGHFDEDLYQSLILEFVRAVCAGKACSKESRSQGYSPTHVSPYLCQPAHVES